MNTVKLTIELEVTPGNEASLKDLLGHVAMMAASPYAQPVQPVDEDPMPEDPEPEPVPESPAPAPKRTRTRTKKANPEPEPEPDPMPDPNLNPVEAEARQGQDPLPSYEKLPPQTPASEKPKYTVEWVRRLLAEKVGKYRAECKQKLADLGAANVSSLDPGKYAEFVDFLNTLNV